MFLTDTSSRTNHIQQVDIMVRKVFIDEVTNLPTVTLEATSAEENSNSFSPIKIPLVSFQPILAASPKYILTNEFTKRKNQFVLYNEDLERLNIRSYIDLPVLSTLWHDDGQRFLILTETSVLTLDPETRETELQQDFRPTEGRTFKCFTLLNQADLFIAYDQWDAQYIDRWGYNKDKNEWKLTGTSPIHLTPNECMTDMSFNHDGSQLAIAVYNDLVEEHRVEFRETNTLICLQKKLLPKINMMHDYRVIPMANNEADIKWLIHSTASPVMIAIDSGYKRRVIKYRHPVQRMALFQRNYLIVRTTERVDIHLFR